MKRWLLLIPLVVLSAVAYRFYKCVSFEDFDPWGDCPDLPEDFWEKR